jgi:hypothetical protein
MFVGVTMEDLRSSVQGFVRPDCISKGVMMQRFGPSKDRIYAAREQRVSQAAAGSTWSQGGGWVRIAHLCIQAI